MDKTIIGLEGWIDCFERANLKGVVKALGVTNISEIENREELNQAFEMGKIV